MSRIFSIALAAAAAALLLLGATARRPAPVDLHPDASGNTTPPSAAVDGGTSRPIASQDGDVIYLGDPPGMRLTVDDQPALVDAGAPDGGTGQSDAGPSEAELQQLRDQLASLEQQLAAAQALSQTEQLQTVNDQLTAIRVQLARDRARRAANAAAAQQAIAQAQNALEALSSAQERLAYGDSDVVDELNYAEAALPFPAQLALENARRAIGSEDLAEARYWISVAIAETERSQISP